MLEVLLLATLMVFFKSSFFLKSLIQTDLTQRIFYLHWFCLLLKPLDLIYLYSALIVLHSRGSVT